CLGIGIVGLWVPYPWPQPPAQEPPPIQAQLLKVQITREELPPPQVSQTAVPQAPDADDPQPPAPPAMAAAPPPPPALMSVAAPSPQVAFAMPVKGPAKIVDASKAVPARPAPTPATQVASAGPPAVRRIVYGQGEGVQPAPEYPREAVIAHEQGTVLVRFTVDAEGNVQSAEAESPSPWPLLNQAAIRAVQDTWRFAPGAPRSYEVNIQFQLRAR
ncbi:MAG: energy transducer TonB, partial [Tepidisphaeraceae bacterium]